MKVVEAVPRSHRLGQPVAVLVDWRGGWLEVYCDWCHAVAAKTRGCLVCRELWDRVDAAVWTPAWLAMHRRKAPLGVLADWLEDRGIVVPREGLA